ncbi:MAG: 8-oxoguanine DNA glycosylase [Clostridia bacterium]|nr:8-oxoguanine DNA glycosylase [Clostridia bacterium]
MKEQTYIIENKEIFCLKHIFECGQCFRWNKQKDGSYTGIFRDNVLNVKQEKDKVIFQGMCEGNIQEEVIKYFDLNTDYEKIKKDLSKVDEPLKNSIDYGNGIRLLNQDLWETIISFIISANNNIPRIKKIIEKLAKQYGRKIKWQEKIYYTFPTPTELSKATVAALRELGLGFRDKRVYETTKMIMSNQIDLTKLEKLAEKKQTKEVRELLLTLPGVGPKVADCIMLFSTLKCLDVFPIDVWVRRVMNELYFKLPEESKLKRTQIEALAKEKYGDLAGIAQQYLFYWKREA